MSIESAELYPNAPLRLVAFELRYPLAMKLASQETLVQIQAALEDELPIVELGVEGGVSFNPQQGFQELPSRPLFKLFSKDRRVAVTLSHISLVVEDARYAKYADLRRLIEKALEGLGGSVRVPGMSRVGLRYVNEVRAPAVLAPKDWIGYVDERLLGPLHLCELPVTEFQIRLQFDTGEGYGVQLNAGTLQGEFVSSQGPLRVDKRSGPAFLIDIDSYVQFEDLQDFDASETITICDRLRQPVRQLFEGSITELLRDEVLRTAGRSQRQSGGEVT